MMGDLSVNCPACGSNPHEECRLPGMGNHKAIDCLVNPVAADSRMDDMTEPETMLEHIEEGHPTMMIRRSFEKAWDVVKEELKVGDRVLLSEDGSTGIIQEILRHRQMAIVRGESPRSGEAQIGLSSLRKV